MRSTFEDLAYATTRVYEGGYVNHPSDPGGATDRGVTWRTYNAYRKRKGLPPQDVRKMTEAECKEIYRTQYWDAVKGDVLPAGVDLVVYDGAVNSGPKQAIKWLQRGLRSLALYDGPIDGVIGQGTLAACESVPDDDKLVTLICDARLAFCKALKGWKTFGKGWSSRIDNVRRKGWAWATGSVGPAPVWSQSGAQKAEIVDAKSLPTTGAADAAAGTGVVTLPGGLTLDAVKDQIAPFQDSIYWLQYASLGLIVAGVAVPAGAMAYRWYANRRRKELSTALDLEPVKGA